MNLLGTTPIPETGSADLGRLTIAGRISWTAKTSSAMVLEVRPQNGRFMDM
jgi:hypothetical protein